MSGYGKASYKDLTIFKDELFPHPLTVKWLLVSTIKWAFECQTVHDDDDDDDEEEEEEERFGPRR